MCGYCIEKCDHHCVWINQCVGLHNYRYFISFLFLHGVICNYGVWAGYNTLMARVEREKLLSQTFRTNDGEIVHADYYVVFRYLYQE